MPHRVGALVSVLLSIAVAHTFAQEDAPTEQSRKYRRGTLRLGAFAVTNIDTSVVARSAVVPVGVYLDLSKDLGLEDSATVPRVLFNYRFSRRHQLDLDWFDLDRSTSKTLGRTIEFPPGNEIPIGVGAEIDSDVSVYKALYTWLFYDQGKVTLGGSFGLNVVDFDLGIRVDPVSLPGNPVDEEEGVTAPLPVIGFRLFYRATSKLNLVFAGDLLAVDIGEYSGTLQDVYAVADYRLSKRFGISGGINSLSFNFKIDNNDALAELRHNYRGFIGFVSVYF